MPCRGGGGNPLQYSCLGNPTDREAWWATIHGITELDTTDPLGMIMHEDSQENAEFVTQAVSSSQAQTGCQQEGWAWLYGRISSGFFPIEIFHTVTNVERIIQKSPKSPSSGLSNNQPVTNLFQLYLWLHAEANPRQHILTFIYCN